MTTYPAESYTHDECASLLEACGRTWVGKRNRALIVVMWRAGLRLGEALALRPQDVDWSAQAIRVLHGKGDKARTVGIDRQALTVLREWFDVRGLDETKPLFCTRGGDPIEQAYVRAMLPRLAQRAGVNKRVHAHGFRHTFAVELARERVPTSHIQMLLGHASLATTSVYLASLSPEEALDAVRGREW
jgi:site-specific recombinase XerC